MTLLPLRGPALPDSCGRKAQMLCRLGAAGLPIKDGWVLPIGARFDDAAASQLAALGPGPYVVRSSSPLEDGALASAAGLYESVTAVPRDGVAAAVAAVRASATDDAVVAYLALRQLSPQPIAVLLQAMVHEPIMGVACSDEQGYLLEERPSGTPEWADSRAQVLARGAMHPVAALMRTIEALVPGPLQVEYARGECTVLLQVRPATARMRVARGAPAMVWPPGRWRLDAVHNPDPLSSAQAGLVALLDGPRFGPRSKVVGEYLYVREDAPLRRVTASDPIEALHRFHETLEPRLRAELADPRSGSLPDALERYRSVLRCYAREVRPALGAERRAFDAFLETEGMRDYDLGLLLGGSGGATSDRDGALYALGHDPTHLLQYLERFGAYAPAWDVAIACDDEDEPRLLSTAHRRARGGDPAIASSFARARAHAAAELLRARLSPNARAGFERGLERLRAMVTLGESDDRLFFEAQRLVRRALLARGRTLVRERRLDAATDIFDLSLDRAQGGVGDLRACVKAARSLRMQARETTPPLRIIDGVPQDRPSAGGQVLRGRPAGGQARGRAVVIRSLDQPLGDLAEGTVLVLPAALPSLAPHLSSLRGLVTEHGGALSHAATLARESGVAAVVGVAGALQIPDGAELYVDGVRGRVIIMT